MSNKSIDEMIEVMQAFEVQGTTSVAYLFV